MLEFLQIPIMWNQPRNRRVGKGDPGIQEFQIFKMLDGLAATSSGTDGMPHWFIRIAAPSGQFSHHTPVQPVSYNLHSSHPMENQCHHSSAQNQAASPMQRLSTNLRHSHSLASARKNSCPQLHLSNLDTPCYASTFSSISLPSSLLGQPHQQSSISSTAYLIFYRSTPLSMSLP